MSPLPSLIVLADRGHFLAYRIHRNNRPEIIDETRFAEGTEKLSEQVTDKAGAFPAHETMGHGTSTAERMPLKAELEMRCFRKIARRIESLLGANPEPWAFAAPSEINGAILDGLNQRLKSGLKVNLKRDLTNVPRSALLSHFRERAVR